MEREKLEILVLEVQKGNVDAQAQLYQEYSEKIYYYILKLVKNPELAADLTQDAFIEILQTIHSLKEPKAFAAWSKKIAYHKCTAHFRKRQELLADENEDGFSVLDTVVEEREEFIPDEALDKEELKKTIQAMIDALPEEQRAALMMRYFDEISVKEIAYVQDVSEGTVKSRLNYARKSLKQSVEEYEQKNGIKLHCKGIIPLLLWLFGENRMSKVHAFSPDEGYEAVKKAVETKADTVIATETTAETAAKTVAKTSIKKLSVKMVAGITAATVAIGGIAITATQNHKNDAGNTSHVTESENTEVETEDEELTVDLADYIVAENQEEWGMEGYIVTIDTGRIIDEFSDRVEYRIDENGGFRLIIDGKEGNPAEIPPFESPDDPGIQGWIAEMIFPRATGAFNMNISGREVDYWGAYEEIFHEGDSVEIVWDEDCVKSLEALFNLEFNYENFTYTIEGE